MKQGYVHPYHTKINPLILPRSKYLEYLNDMVGPEQVSPHYETVSRSRRGVIFFFLYIGVLTTLTSYGGWES